MELEKGFGFKIRVRANAAGIRNLSKGPQFYNNYCGEDYCSIIVWVEIFEKIEESNLVWATLIIVVVHNIHT